MPWFLCYDAVYQKITLVVEKIYVEATGTV